MQIPFLTPITIWSRWCKGEDNTWRWEHNHLEQGNCSKELPTPRHENHKRSWASGKWTKKFGFLTDDNKVV